MLPPPRSIFIIIILLTISGLCVAGEPPTTILFTTLGRSTYAFDIYSVPVISVPQPDDELRHTHSHTVNFNGHFPSTSAVSLLPIRSGCFPLLFVSELNGSANVYLDTVPEPASRRSAVEFSLSGRPEPYPLLVGNGISMKDRPSIAGNRLIYVSTHEKADVSRKSWAAVYSTDLESRATLRLTPRDIADFSPSVSPSGEWTAVASSGEKGWTGEIEDLVTDIYVFRTRDGSGRTRVVVHGGWPCWSSDSTIYFHRRSDDGWWSVYRVGVGEDNGSGSGSITAVSPIERITPSGIHAFTPATSAGGDNNFIAVATRRPSSEFRHIELFDLANKVFVKITQRISPQAHHYNPFLSPDGTRVGYHRCTGGSKPLVLLDNVPSPTPDISLFRIDGSFPSFSPDGNQIAFVGLPGLYVINRDGSGRRKLLPETAFATAWDPKRKDVIYTSYGPVFAAETTGVNVISVHFAGNSPPAVKVLTTGGGNNAFPSPSPDGKWVVFRSGRSGHKNLYIMDAVNGEAGSLVRLTDGEWSDTMANWSPDGQWIAFASDRDNPGSGSFAMYKIRPDGSGLRKVVESGVGGGGRTNHPWFSPDSKRLVFTSDYAAVSGEPVANAHHFQPYGEIFVADADGGHVTRLTHNTYEDGTPTWGRALVKGTVLEGPDRLSNCSFQDCHWLSEPSSVRMWGEVCRLAAFSPLQCCSCMCKSLLSL